MDTTTKHRARLYALAVLILGLLLILGQAAADAAATLNQAGGALG